MLVSTKTIGSHKLSVAWLAEKLVCCAGMRISHLAQQQQFMLFDLSEVALYATWFGLPWPDATSRQQINWLVREILTQATDGITGVLLDAYLGYETVADLSLHQSPAQTGIAYTLLEEKNQQLMPYASWGVEEIAANYATAYVRLPYHPEEEHALEKKKILAEIADYCRLEKVDLITYLQITGVNGGRLHPDDLPAAQLQAVSELRPHANLWILDHPGSQLNAATLTAELDSPWVMTCQETDQTKIKMALRQALDGGAVGYMVSPVWWQAVGQLRSADMSPDQLAISEYIKTQLRDQLLELTRIAQETL